MDNMNRPYENEGPKILAATLTVTIAALITFIIRMYVRMKMIRNVGWDDYIMGFAMVLCITGQIIIFPQVHYGAGRHIWEIPPLDFQKAFKLNFVSQPIYLIAICVVKLSIGYFLLRVAVTPFYRRLIIGIMAFMGFYTLGCFFTVVLQCTNLAVMWDPTVKGTCWGPKTLKALSYTNVALNILTDLLFAIIIPIPMLWNVQMNSRQKMSIMGILGLGIFATAAAFVKVSYLTNYGKEGDWLWDSRDITIWTVVECNIGIIAGNLPCLKPLFRRVLGSTYGLGSNKNSGNKYFSRPGVSTGRNTKDYNSLASGKTHGADAKDDIVVESHMMTNMKVNNHDGRTSRSSGADEEIPKGSAESVAWLNEQPPSKWGAITKTTEVNVTRTGGDAGVDDISKPPRKETHLV